MVKIIWTVIALNTLLWLVFIGAYFVLNNGKQVSYEEKGWTVVLASLGLIFILLAAIPIRISQSNGTLIFSGIMALLPLLLLLLLSLS
ncbi:MAG: hypothetical protein EOP53_20790 [Sphingobacteriales bacterium]|nr:MAG: hypothetical protein EOP53_20790 [Sphingobacteriales bacterium]